MVGTVAQDEESKNQPGKKDTCEDFWAGKEAHHKVVGT